MIYFRTQYTLSEINSKKFDSIWSMMIWILVHIGVIQSYHKTDFTQIKNISSRPNKKKIHRYYRDKVVQLDHETNWMKKIGSSLVIGIGNSTSIRNTFNNYLDDVIYDKVVYLCKWVISLVLICVVITISIFIISLVLWCLLMVSETVHHEFF